MSESDKLVYLYRQMGYSDLYVGSLGGLFGIMPGEEDYGRCSLISNVNWQFFGLLWEWAQEQEWFSDFATQANGYRRQNFIYPTLIHPDIFTNAVYEFLKARES